MLNAEVQDDQVMITVEYAAGEKAELVVIRSVKNLCEVSRNTGGESREQVRGEIRGNLHGMGVDSDVFRDICGLVEDMLVEEGVVFYED